MTDAVDVYWRPGCGFCSRLLRKLDRSGLPLRLHNIWEDPDAAEIVRAAARGNETVPTVGVGDAYLVNPGLHDVMDLVGRNAPELLDRAPGSAQG
jgi:glutaredoxin